MYDNIVARFRQHKTALALAIFIAAAPAHARITRIVIDETISPALTKDDVITIPANTPHQWKDTSKTGSVGYYAVNIEQ